MANQENIIENVGSRIENFNIISNVILMKIVYRFENGYGAVRLESNQTHGIELSVCKFIESKNVDEYVIDRTTHITTGLTDGIFCFLKDAEVQPILEKIKAL
jgi:hypothetical protein